MTGEHAIRKPIVIFGGGRQGLSILKWLGNRAKDVLFVTQKAREIEEIESLHLDLVTLDFHRDESLREVGIGQWVKMIFCALEEDSENVFLTLSARALDPRLAILCIAETHEASQKMLAAGATTVIDSHEIAGKRINELIHRPTVVEALEQTVLGESDLMLAEIRIERDSRLNGVHLSEVPMADYNLILFGVVDLEQSDRLIFRPLAGERRLDPGDYLVVIGPEAEIERFKQDLSLGAGPPVA